MPKGVHGDIWSEVDEENDGGRGVGLVQVACWKAVRVSPSKMLSVFIRLFTNLMGSSDTWFTLTFKLDDRIIKKVPETLERLAEDLKALVPEGEFTVVFIM